MKEDYLCFVINALLVLTLLGQTMLRSIYRANNIRKVLLWRGVFKWILLPLLRRHLQPRTSRSLDRCRTAHSGFSEPTIAYFSENHLEKCYPQTTLLPLFMPIGVIQRCRNYNKFGREKLIVFDEADYYGSKYYAVLMGVLDSTGVNKPYLIDIQVSDASPKNTVQETIIKGMRKVNKVQQFPKFKLLLTDGAIYNKAAAGTLKVLYPDLTQVTSYSQMVARLSAKIAETEKVCIRWWRMWRKYSKNATGDNLNGANLKVNAVHFQCQYWDVGEHGCRLFLNIWALVKFEKFPRKNSTIWLSCSSKSVRSYATAKGSRDCWIHCLFILLSHLSKFRKLKTLPSYRPWNSSTP